MREDLREGKWGEGVGERGNLREENWGEGEGERGNLREGMWGEGEGEDLRVEWGEEEMERRGIWGKGRGGGGREDERALGGTIRTKAISAGCGYSLCASWPSAEGRSRLIGGVLGDLLLARGGLGRSGGGSSCTSLDAEGILDSLGEV